MKPLKRHLDHPIKSHFNSYKEILILLGARQVGKTTLLKRIFPDAYYFLVDNEPVRKNLESYDIFTYKQFIPKDTVIVIDEIHQLSDPGRAAKIIYDQIPNIKLIVTGSSSLNIKNKMTESLAGRKVDYHLCPLTFIEYLYQNEIINYLNLDFFNKIVSIKSLKNSVLSFDLQKILNQVLTFGLYPHVIDHPADEKYLLNLVDSVIFKDIADLQLIDDRNTALNILKLLAHQIGHLVNLTEISNRLQKDVRTIQRYLQIFEKSYLIFTLSPFSKNKRDEIGKTHKIYFYDLGIRNALINNFTDINLRPDRGQLFENFIITECLKANQYLNAGYALHFWRTKHQAEVDLVLQKQEQLIGIEIKYSNGRVSKAFSNRYPEALTKLITSLNFLSQ